MVLRAHRMALSPSTHRVALSDRHWVARALPELLLLLLHVLLLHVLLLHVLLLHVLLHVLLLHVLHILLLLMHLRLCLHLRARRSNIVPSSTSWPP